MAYAVRPFSQIPGPRSWPLFGTALRYRIGSHKLEEYQESLKDVHERYGNIVKQNFAGQRVVQLFDPNDIQKVFSVEGKYPRIIPLQPNMQIYRKLRNINIGLGNLNGEEWYKLRIHIQKNVMRPPVVRNYLPIVEKSANEFVQQIRKRRNKNHEVENLFSLSGKVILENAGKIFLSSSIGCLDGGAKEEQVNEAIKYNFEVFRLSAELRFSLPLHRYFYTPTWKRFIEVEDNFLGFISAHINDAIENKRKSLKTASGLESQMFLLYLLSQPDLNNDEVFILIFSMLADGLTTTSPALINILYCLSQHQQVQQKLYEEIQRVLKDDEPITTQKIEMMPYLRACVKESLRLCPIVTEISRILPTDLVLSNYLVPAGTCVELNQSVVLTSNEYFSDAESYRPERWLNTGSGSGSPKQNPFVYTPFSHGVRMCAGRRIAEQDLHVIVCRLMQNFHMEYKSSVPLKMKYAMLLFPDHSPLITFTERK